MLSLVFCLIGLVNYNCGTIPIEKMRSSEENPRSLNVEDNDDDNYDRIPGIYIGCPL